MMQENDSILVFEYFTASGEKDKCIISEAEALIFALLDDLKDYNIDLVINESYKNAVGNFKNVNPILIDCDVVDWLSDNAANFTKAIFISAENNNNLFCITKILEDSNVEVYNSSSSASHIASDKFESYKKLENIVPQPLSFKMEIDHNGDWKKTIKDVYKKRNSSKLIIKPLIGVDCEDIVVIDELRFDLDKIFKPGTLVLVQEFIEGTDISVSLISDGKKAVPISLNKQFILLENDRGNYLGGKLPFNAEFRDDAYEIAVKAVESVDGLRGFVGVDLIISDEGEIYLLEINSRFTTPYVGLKKIADINIGKTIIEVIDKKLDINELNISLDGEVEFKKSGDNLDIRRV